MSERWSFLVDPAWRPPQAGGPPPFSAVIGGWFVPGTGEPGPFRANPGYRPSHPGMPTDPVDVALQRLALGDGDPDELVTAVGSVLLGLAVDGSGAPLVAAAPDGVPSVLVATAPLHRSIVDAPAWRESTAEGLLAVLPPHTDILLNPGGDASMRLAASALRGLVQPVAAPDAASGFWEDDVFGGVA